MAEHYHIENHFVGSEVVCSSLLDSITTIVFDREFQQWFRSVRVIRNTRHKADSTKYTKLVVFHQYLAGLSILNYGHLIIFSWVIVIESFFITTQKRKLFNFKKNLF